ncbi:MAG: TolC family protein [Silvibacterium sp.]|nr:TolC family protein [Silvibacterium sp.]
MVRLRRRQFLLVGLLLAPAFACAQSAPPAADHPWELPSGSQQPLKLPARHAEFVPDPSQTYALADLVNIAEQNNPETRVAWENAKARAADLGISKSTLYPTLAATAVATSARANIFFGTAYFRQTTYTFAPALTLDYIIFDFGRRADEITISKYNLIAANLQFNDTHRTVIFGVMQAYYRLLNARGQQDAAEANLKNAQTVREDSEARLNLGLATLPDVLEARSAEAQADYDLQATIGATEIAYGDLMTSLGLSPTVKLQVQGIKDLKVPDEITITVEKSIDLALAQRPDLMQRVAQLRAASAEIKAAHSNYLPTLSVDGDAGLSRTYGEQYGLPGIYSPTQEFWNARLSLNWTIFDGWAREQRVKRAKADQKQAAADIDAIRDQVENEVWAAYSTARTALRQQRAAAALLASATESYNAALESYRYGVRSQIDVVSAQRTLAQARTADVNARTQLLTGIAALAFQTGDLLYGRVP